MKKEYFFLFSAIILATVVFFGFKNNFYRVATFSKTPQSKEIEVYFPGINTKSVNTKFVITGKGRAFENTINYRVSDSSGRQLYMGSFMTDAQDAGLFGNFKQEIDLNKIANPVPDKIRLDVFEASARDGSDTNKTSFLLDVIK